MKMKILLKLDSSNCSWMQILSSSIKYRNRDQWSSGVDYATCTTRWKTSERQVKSTTRNRSLFCLSNETLRGRASSSRIMIAIGVTHSSTTRSTIACGPRIWHALLACCAFNTEDRSYEFSSRLTLPTGNTRQKRLELR